MAISALSNFGTETKLALAGVQSKGILHKRANLILLTLYVLLKLTFCLLKRAFQEFRKYINKIDEAQSRKLNPPAYSRSVNRKIILHFTLANREIQCETLITLTMFQYVAIPSRMTILE